jgi:DnaJ-class molecular chaperone
MLKINYKFCNNLNYKKGKTMIATNFKGHGMVVCSECGGLGIKKSTLKDICPECNGEGRLYVSICCQIFPLAKNGELFPLILIKIV